MLFLAAFCLVGVCLVTYSATQGTSRLFADKRETYAWRLQRAAAERSRGFSLCHCQPNTNICICAREKESMCIQGRLHLPLSSSSYTSSQSLIALEAETLRKWTSLTHYYHSLRTIAVFGVQCCWLNAFVKNFTGLWLYQSACHEIFSKKMDGFLDLWLFHLGQNFHLDQSH